VVDVAPLQPAQTVEVAWADGRRSTGTHWLDVIEPGDGEVLARYDSTAWAGRPAVLDKRVGAGRAVYLGTRLDDATLRGLLAGLRGEPEAGPPGAAGVERVVRRAATASYEFLINHAGRPAEVRLAAAGLDLLSGATVGGRLELPPEGVAIIRRAT